MKYKPKVILSEQVIAPSQWRYWDYGSASGNLIGDWYAGLSIEAKDKIDALLKNNAKIDNPKDWSGCFKYLQGSLKKEKIWQLSTHDAGGQIRILGIFGAKRKQAVLLIGCTHKESVYNPPNALESAVRRAKNFRNGEVKVYERSIRADF